MKILQLETHYKDFNQYNSGSCWLIRPIQSLNLFLSRKLDRNVEISIDYIYLLNIKEDAIYSILREYKYNINGGGSFYSFRNLLTNYQVYESRNVTLSSSIYDKRFMKYFFKRINRIVKNSIGKENKDLYLKKINKWFSTLYKVEEQNNDTKYAFKYLIRDFFSKYYINERLNDIEYKDCSYFQFPYSRKSNRKGVVILDDLGKELKSIKKYSNSRLIKNIKTPYMKDVAKYKKVMNRINENIFKISLELRNGNIVLISFLYNKKQRHFKLKGFQKTYQRHLAMIIGEDGDDFIIKDSRDNIEGEYIFKVNKEKLVFLSGEIDIFKKSILLGENK